METFPYVIDLALSESVKEEEIGFRTLKTNFEDGKTQYRSMGTPRKRYTKKFSQLEVDADAVWSFHQARLGAFDKFTLQIRDRAGVTTSKTVRFEEDYMSREIFYGVLFTTGISFVEDV